eukprot:m.39172 g.39172  ORF g.39172 m.39172 type:complete len:447 (+) comp11245_c0_seq2:179-1519(+)
MTMAWSVQRRPLEERLLTLLTKRVKMVNEVLWLVVVVSLALLLGHVRGSMEHRSFTTDGQDGTHRFAASDVDARDPLYPDRHAEGLLAVPPSHGARQRRTSAVSDSSKHPVPGLVGIGCEKCGSTTVWKLLQRMAWAVPASTKETRAFLRRPPDTAARYRRYWPVTIPDGHVAFEFTPKYAAARRVPPLLWQSHPAPHRVALLLLLRNPAARALSSFYQARFAREKYPQYIPRHLNKTVLDARAFEDVIDLEHAYLLRCYTPATGAMIISLRQCPTPARARDMQVQREVCMQSYVDSVVGSTPSRSVMASNAMPWSKDEVVWWLGHSFLAAGIFADQISAFLCAGFQPHQFIVVATSQLHNQTSLAINVSRALGVPAVFASRQAEEEARRGFTLGHRAEAIMSHDTLARLHRLFETHNHRLHKLLTAGFTVTDPAAIAREFHSLTS